MLLARDGHQVVVLERETEGPPADPLEAGERWQRHGLNQSRMGHVFAGGGPCDRGGSWRWASGVRSRNKKTSVLSSVGGLATLLMLLSQRRSCEPRFAGAPFRRSSCPRTS